MQKTPLRDFHAAHGARLVDFAGWEMPVQYRSILEEHRAVRRAAGLFDVSHMGEVTVAGPDAGSFLNRLVTNDVAKLFPGRALYTPMCYPNGGVVDDLLLAHYVSKKVGPLALNLYQHQQAPTVIANGEAFAITKTR